MYPNVRGEMAKYNKRLEDLARATGKTVGTMSLKLAGKAELTWSECKAIHRELGTKLTMEELFSEEAL